jgi:anaerobic selenocysteine-containing dehydrogenase
MAGLGDDGKILVNPLDAERLGVTGNGARIRITGPAGAMTGPVAMTEQVPAGLMFAAYNFTELNAQQVIDGSSCVAVTAVKA